MIRTYAYKRGYVGTNGGTAAGLVGILHDMARRLRTFADLGITTFLLPFHPMMEEMKRFGERVIPLLPLDDGLDEHEALSNTARQKRSSHFSFQRSW